MELDFFKLIWQASLLVQVVIAMLAVASVLSWAAILFKLRELRGAEQDSEAFLAAYQQGSFEDAEKAARANTRSPLSAVMLAGVAELKRTSLMTVPGGNIRVAPTTVEGPYGEFPGLVDRLVALLLAQDGGVPPHRLPELAATTPPPCRPICRA